MQKKSFLIDTNLFISAFKSGPTKSTELFIKLVKDEDIELIANSVLIEEYKRYGKKLGSKSQKFFQIIKDNCTLVDPSKKQIEECNEFFQNSYADAVHAASCLKYGSILLTNDKDFNEIKESNIIDIWNISDAIENIL